MKHALALILSCCVLCAQEDAGFSQLYAKAKSGDPISQYKVGVIYQNGLAGQRRDDAEATRWFQLSAVKGLAEAQAQYAFMIGNKLHGRGDYEGGFFYTELSANQGYDYGMGQLGYYYFHGQGVTKDYAQAYKWLVLAAATGDGTGDVLLKELKPLITLEELREGQLLAAGFKPHRRFPPLSKADRNGEIIYERPDGVKSADEQRTLTMQAGVKTTDGQSAFTMTDVQYVTCFIGILVLALFIFWRLEAAALRRSYTSGHQPKQQPPLLK
jgi:hypothetical protein